jgi:hypothetical protein
MQAVASQVGSAGCDIETHDAVKIREAMFNAGFTIQRFAVLPERVV